MNADDGGTVARTMGIPAQSELRRLTLQLERDLLAQTRLRVLLSAADTTVRDHRASLREVSARIRRAERAHESKRVA